MGRLKILFVIDFLGKGGAERQLINLVNNISQDLFEIMVVTIVRPGYKASELNPVIKKTHLNVGSRNQYPKAIFGLRKCILKFEPNIIHSWLDFSAFISRCAISLVRHPVNFFCGHRVSIDELYSNDVRFGYIKKKLLLWAYKKASKLTTNSQSLVDQLNSFGYQNTELIYNGVVVHKVGDKKSLRAKLGLDGPNFWILFAGALVKRKGIFDLLKAFSLCSNPSLRLLLVGDGRDKTKVMEFVKKDPRILAKDYSENLSSYIIASDLVILPSQYEGLPNVLIEAMLLETPIAGSNIYGISELIHHQNTGQLFSYGNIKEIVNCLNFSFENQNKIIQYANNALSNSFKFQLTSMVEGYERLYLESLNS